MLLRLQTVVHYMLLKLQTRAVAEPGNFVEEENNRAFITVEDRRAFRTSAHQSGKG